MPRYDASQAEILVFTFKEGILSAMAHDLKLRVTSFELDATDTDVKVKIDASSLRVVSPMKDGAENAGALPKMLYAEIEKNAANDVLHAKKYPEIVFESTAITETQVSGKLTLHGTTKELTGKRTAKNTASFTFDQRDFGIKPYSAMLGTLKVRPDVVITVTLPA